MPFCTKIIISLASFLVTCAIPTQGITRDNERKSGTDDGSVNVLLERYRSNDYQSTDDNGVDEWLGRIGYTKADCDYLRHGGRESSTINNCKKAVLIQQKIMEKAKSFDFSQGVKNMCIEVKTRETQYFSSIKEKCVSCEKERKEKEFTDFFEARRYMQQIDACEEYLEASIEEYERLKVLAKQDMERAKIEAEQNAKEKQKEEDRKKLQKDLLD